MWNRRTVLGVGLATGFGGILLEPAGTRASVTDYQADPVEYGGRVAGRVFFEGTLPEPDRIIIGKDNHICGDGHVTPDPLQVSSDRGLENTVVAVANIVRGKAWPAKEAEPLREIVQEACAFHPYVQVAPKGIDLRIVNKDPLLHNIHAYEQIGRARRTLFNIAQPEAGQVDVHPLKLRRGHIVEIDCDAHNWMSAWIYTLDHPNYAITDSEGRFEIGDVPSGAYEIVAWHPLLGQTRQSLRIDADQTTPLDLSLKA